MNFERSPQQELVVLKSSMLNYNLGSVFTFSIQQAKPCVCLLPQENYTFERKSIRSWFQKFSRTSWVTTVRQNGIMEGIADIREKPLLERLFILEFVDKIIRSKDDRQNPGFYRASSGNLFFIRVIDHNPL